MLAVACLAVAASVVGLFNDFANDDVELIVRNTRIHDLGQWMTWFSKPFWPPPFSEDLYRPLTSAVLAIEYAIGGDSPVMFRIASYVFYAISAVLVYRLARRRLDPPFAFGAAALFAVHPVHVEAIALGVGQAEILVGIFSTFAIIAYVDARGRGALPRPRWLLVGAAYVAAILAKEQGYVLVGLLVAAECILFDAKIRDHVRGLAGVPALCAIAALLLTVRHHVLGSLAGTFTAEALVGANWQVRLLTALALVPEWLRLLFWPAHLRSDYSPQELVASTHVGAAEVAGLILVVAAVASAWHLRKKAPMYTFGVAWTAIALVPVSNVLILTGILLAERTLFLPSIGAMLAVGALAQFVNGRFPSRDMQQGLVAASAMLVVLGLARSAERQHVWRRDAIVVARSSKDAPKSFRVQRALGDLMFEIGQPQLATEAYTRALAYVPEFSRWRVRNNYARTLARAGRHAEAISQFTASLAQNPDQEYVRGELLATELLTGRYAAASAQADTAIARGGNRTAFAGLKALADSAARVGAPEGTIRVGLERAALHNTAR